MNTQIRKMYDAAHGGGSSKDELVEKFADLKMTRRTAELATSIAKEYSEERERETAVAALEFVRKGLVLNEGWPYLGRHISSSELYTIFYNERKQQK